jgi:hypothetical protein
MTVSNAMTEAGIATYERINRARMSPQAIVAAIYNAMDTVRRREAIKAPGPAATYVHQAWPSYRYGPNGESRVFLCAEDVPEGWSDTPDFVTVAREMGAETMADLAEKRRPGRPRKEAA